MTKTYKRIVSMALAATMVLTFSPAKTKVEAQQVAGDAPFINSWLVSGPFDEPVVDKIYGSEVEKVVNYAPLADITASSETLATNPAGVEITPEVGEALSYEGESQKWEYFDDRIYNRNYDDYQDLYGYYTVKKGIDTRNKYVNAHTYVYSPDEQEAYFNVGASGSYRLYVNDEAVTTPSVPVEVQKDLTQQVIQLKEGWNKLMIQIEHTYTEDVNENDVPIGKDQHVAYLGFYGRIADQNGNEISGLIHSSEGETETLNIVTQGLSTEDDLETSLPAGNMPIGYKEWPYVWNKSVNEKNYGVAASAFQFMASGGEPGYTWEISKGKLPEGLELNADGTIADGVKDGKADLSSDKGIISIGCEPGDYTFTVKVTDSGGKTATKDFTITVKERPNKWFEEGRVGALTHATASYNDVVDPNYSVDLWAERAKRQGHSLVSIETLQQLYYWPSKFADPKHERHTYLAKDENGKLIDGLKQFEEAIKRHGMKFGVYYATEGGGIGHHSTDVLVQNVEDLILRYDPAYVYFDGPQAMPNANYDVMYSSIRNHSDDIIVNSNAWGDEYGDPDLRTGETDDIYANSNGDHLVKRTIMEPWKMIRTKNGQSIYYGMRDDFRQVIKEMVSNAGRGYVDNNDQTIVDGRGTFWHSPKEVTTMYPQATQEFIDVREAFIEWYAPEGKPERHEATTGTTPYYLSGYGYDDDGKGNYESFAFPNASQGPQWGYATYRDNNIYLHIMEGPDEKKGFDAISDKTLTISPVKDRVTSVTWLNEDIPVTSFTQRDDALTIDLTNVTEDPVDTIIKITTDNPERKYTLTNVKATGEQLTDASLGIRTEGYMTFPALQVKLTGLTYESEDPAIVSINQDGIVTPVSDGTTTITVSGTHEDITKQDTLKVTSKGGKIYVGEEMLSATLKVEGKETNGEFDLLQKLSYEIEGRSSKGGAIGLGTAEIKWHGGIIDLETADKYDPVVIKEVDTFIFTEEGITVPYVEEKTRGIVWADVTLDGKTVTTNKVFMDILPEQNLANTAEITASHNEEAVKYLVDGKTINGIDFDNLKWSVPANEEAWIEFKLPTKADIANINLNFNSLDQSYINTPKIMKIQTSNDGVEWEDVSTVDGPTDRAYFGFYTPYEINTKAQYVKLIMDGGANGSTIDLLEVGIKGVDSSNMFDDFTHEYKEITSSTGRYIIEALKGSGETAEDVVVKVSSLNPEIISVDEQNVLTAVSEGVAKINISAEAGGRTIRKTTYIGVDKNENIYDVIYLNNVNLSLSKSTIKIGNPIIASIEGFLSTGEAADLSGATVEYQFSNPKLFVIDGSNTIVVEGDVSSEFNATVTAKVTLDEITVESQPMAIAVVRDIIPQSGMTATATDEETVNENNPASMAIDGDPSTFWHTAWNNSDDFPQSITLDLGGAYDIDSISYLPRQSGNNGNIIEYKMYVSDNGEDFAEVASGAWANDDKEKVVKFDSIIASHVKVEAIEGVGGHASAAEINVFKTKK